MKLNWGSSIAIFYSLFVVVMISAVVLAVRNETHLVQENYYDQDLNYESYRQKRLRGQKVQTIMTKRTENGKHFLHIALPKAMADATGSLTLYRPSNKYIDKTYPIELDPSGRMDVLLPSNMASGLWRIKLDWESEQLSYFKESSIVL